MSAPSVLPNRSSPLYSGPCPVIQSLMDQVGEIEDPQNESIMEDNKDEDEEKRRGKVEDEHRDTHNPRRPVVSFSDDVQWHSPNRSIEYEENGPQVSSPHSRRKRQKTENGKFSRKVETPNVVPVSSRQSSLAEPNLPTKDVRKWIKLKEAPLIASRRARRSLASRSSRKSHSSDQDFFTPPSTRQTSRRMGKGKGKAFEPTNNLPNDITLGKTSVLRMDPIRNSSNLLNEQDKTRSPTLGSSTPDDSHFAPLSTMEGPSSIEMSGSSDPRSSSSMKHTRPEVVELPILSSWNGRLHDDSPNQMAEASSSQDFPSSSYSQSKPHVFRSHSRAMDGGADTATPLIRSPTRMHRKSFSFENRLHDIEALAEQRYMASNKVGVWTGGKRREISRLRDDNETLKKQMSDLRDEFRTLKEVLLQVESHRRWREIECSS